MMKHASRLSLCWLALAASASMAAPAARPGLAQLDPGIEDRAKNLIVMVDGELEGLPSSGAGIIMSVGPGRVYVATAKHVVRSQSSDAPAENIRVGFYFLPGESVEARLLEDAFDDVDLAVLAVDLNQTNIPADRIPFDLLGNDAALDRGHDVYHVGNPGGNDWWVNVQPDKVSTKTLTAVRFQTTATSPGSSGGGLFNDRGEVIGMVVANSPPEGQAIPISVVMEQLRARRYPVDLVAAPANAGTAPPTATTPNAPTIAEDPKGGTDDAPDDGFSFEDLAAALVGDLAAANPYSIDFEDGQFPASYVGGTGGTWELDDSLPATGRYSLHSPVLFDDQESGFAVTSPADAVSVTFDYFISSEDCCDNLHIHVNGEHVGDLYDDSANGWRTQQVFLAFGGSTIEWVYVKDESVSEDSDRVWIDNIRFE